MYGEEDGVEVFPQVGFVERGIFLCMGERGLAQGWTLQEEESLCTFPVEQKMRAMLSTGVPVAFSYRLRDGRDVLFTVNDWYLNGRDTSRVDLEQAERDHPV